VARALVYDLLMILLRISIAAAWMTASAFSQAPASSVIRDFPEYRIYSGAIHEGGFPVSSARLCTVGAKPQCFALAPQTNGADHDQWFYFGVRPTSKRINVGEGGSLVLFNANCWGGSGSSDRYVLLQLLADGRLKNLLPEIIVSNQAEVAAWELPTVSPMPVLLTADFLWQGGEAH
jgi:hypothetical protein